MNHWRDDLRTTIQNLMPYAFLDSSGARTPINEEEFNNVLGYITEQVSRFRKYAFKSGYLMRAKKSLEHHILEDGQKLSPLPETEVEDFLADRAFEEWEKSINV